MGELVEPEEIEYPHLKRQQNKQPVKILGRSSSLKNSWGIWD